MAHRLLALTIVLSSSLVYAADRQPATPSAQSLFNDAQAKEKAVRTALADPDIAPSVLKAVRTAVSSFDALVRLHPTSGYCDDALWRGAKLSLDAFERFGEVQERDAASRFLRALIREYPSSDFVTPAQALLDDPATLTAKAAPTADVSHISAAAPGAGPARIAGTAPAPGVEAPRAPTPRPAAATPGQLVTITDIRRTVLPDAVRITIELDGEVPFQDDRIADPARVYVDLASAVPVAALANRTIRFGADADLVSQVRVGERPGHTTRIVLDDVAGVSTYSVYPLYSPYRLVIDCLRPTRSETAAERVPARPSASPAEATASAAKPIQPSPFPRPVGPPVDIEPVRVADASADKPVVAKPSTDQAPTVRPTADGTPEPIAPLVAAAAPVSPAPTLAAGTPVVAVAHTPPVPPAVMPARASAVPPVAPEPPARNIAGGFSMARQLGLSVSRIVIDPGHGGHDPGAKAQGSTEAALVLDVALKLEKLLAKVPGVEVVLTRRTDEFIPLQERTAIANRENADLFLSIHANASRSKSAHGVETYFLNFATNSTAEEVAARENSGSGRAMGDLDGVVKTIALNNKLDESRDFASMVQQAMIDKLKASNKRVKDLGVKQAPFVVLIGASMPSVLAEISFITNRDEAKLLKTSAYRQRIADALFGAIRKYQTSLRGVSTVAAHP